MFNFKWKLSLFNKNQIYWNKRNSTTIQIKHIHKSSEVFTYNHVGKNGCKIGRITGCSITDYLNYICWVFFFLKIYFTQTRDVNDFTTSLLENLHIHKYILRCNELYFLKSFLILIIIKLMNFPIYKENVIM